MPLNDRYPLAVTFITVGGEPAGTGFIVNVPTRIDDLFFEYVVTASHVVASGRDTAIRIRTRAGGVKDVPVSPDDWVHHSHADVAAAPFQADADGGMHLQHVPSASMRWPDILDWHPVLGDRVYFLGLLAVGGTESLVAKNVPMVRSGTIGAMYQDDIPHRQPCGSIRNFQSHLIDCRSFGGFSGSPCFFQRDDQPAGVVEGTPIRGTHTFLLGLVSGHFEDSSVARPHGDIGEPSPIEVPINTGVGLVTPVERIAELLDLKEFAEERERAARTGGQ